MKWARRVALELLVLAAVVVGLVFIEGSNNEEIRNAAARDTTAARAVAKGACRNRKETLGFIAANARQQGYSNQLKRVEQARPRNCTQLVDRRFAERKEARDGQDQEADQK